MQTAQAAVAKRPAKLTGPRTFRAADVRGALAAVKAALGAEAVIIGTREVNNGLFRTGEIEITASADMPEPTPQEQAPVQAESNRVPLSDQLFDHFLDRGIERSLARVLTRRTLAGGAKDVSTAEVAARALVAMKLQTSPAPWLRGQRRVMALVGPTGVGKTTTIAKVAARALLESRLKVSLITVDTYRIGASEQLARYGDIMRVPTFVASDANQLNRALDESKGSDLVLIDTAGRFAEPEVMKQARMLQAVPGIEMMLTLSMTASARDLDSTADKYRFLNPGGIILTKLDEAVAPGACLSAAIRLSRPVACVTNGQRVPEDIHPATNAQLVDLIMGAGFFASRATPSPSEKEY